MLFLQPAANFPRTALLSGAQNLTEKLELTETCKGIRPEGLGSLFFPEHQWRKAEEGQNAVFLFASFEELHKISGAAPFLMVSGVQGLT